VRARAAALLAGAHPVRDCPPRSCRWLTIAAATASITTAVLLSFAYGMRQSYDVGRSMAFACWMVAHVLLGWNMRTTRQPVVL
jgi:hypothetical protein